MSTTHHVKMAKASQADIDAAIELYQFLQAMSDGGRASDAVAEFGYTGYGDLVALDADDVAFVLRAHERGGLFRVVWGLQVLLDPANEVVDPNLPHLELHPKHEQAARERDEARAEVERVAKQRDELVAVARHVVFEGLFRGGEGKGLIPPPFLIPSERLRQRLVELRDAIAAEQPKPAGGA